MAGEKRWPVQKSHLEVGLRGVFFALLSCPAPQASCASAGGVGRAKSGKDLAGL